MEPVHFKTPEDLRDWLAVHHASEQELTVLLYKKHSAVESINWAQLVDEVLCFGWIDGKAKRVDEDRYTIRITPRKPGSIWSKRNIQRVEALINEGRMQPAGLRAFEGRSEDRSGIYSFEQVEQPALSEEFQLQLDENEAAREFFEAQAPWYRRAATHWVMSAKRESTRERRMTALIGDSAQGRTIGPLTRNR